MARKSPVKKKCKKSQTRDLQSKRCRKKKSPGRKSLKRKTVSKMHKSVKKSKSKSKKVKSKRKSKKVVLKKKKTASSYFSTKLKGVGNGVDDRTRVYDWLDSNLEFKEKCNQLYSGFDLAKVRQHSMNKGSDNKDREKYILKEKAQEALNEYNRVYLEHFHTEYKNEVDRIVDEKSLVEAAYYYMFTIVLYLEYKNPNAQKVTETQLKNLSKETTQYKYERNGEDQVREITSPINGLWPLPPENDYKNIFMG
jgi:hypothetical protein